MSSSIVLTLLLWTLLTGLFMLPASYIASKRCLTPGFWLWMLIVPSVVLLPIPNLLPEHIDYANSAEVTAFEPLVWVAHNITTPLKQSWAMSWSQALLILLLLISVVKLVWLAKHYRAARRLVKQSARYPEALANRAIKAKVDCVLLSPASPPTSAFVIGLYRPCIVLPEHFLQLPQHQQQMILAHELNHIRFYDHWWLMAWHIVCALAWFNPFLVRLSAHFTHAVEMRCDAATLAQTPFSRNAYAEALVASLKLSLKGAHSLNDESMQLSFTGHSPGLAQYKQRIRAVLGHAPEHLRWQRLMPLFLVALAVMAFARSTYTWALASAPDSWMVPVAEPTISSVFGHVARIRHNRAHQGVDFKGPVGTAIYASAAGQVLIADATTLNANYGKVVVVQHGDGWQTLYAHLERIDVQKGERVKQGEIIGTMGTTGKVTGSHLHFELIQDGQRQDPMVYFGHAGKSEDE